MFSFSCFGKQRETVADLRSNWPLLQSCGVAISQSSLSLSIASMFEWSDARFFINSHFPRADHLKMATRCIAPPKWRPPSPIFCSIKMAHACRTHVPRPSSKPVPPTHKLRPPHSHTPFLQTLCISPGSSRGSSSCISTRAGRGSSPPYMPPSSRPVGSHPALHRLP